MIKPYQYKSGYKESENAWSSIAEDLNKISEVHFGVNQVSEIGVVIYSINTKIRCEERKENLAPIRKILNLIT